MGEFRRQRSKIWWATYSISDFSQYTGCLDWGEEIDLSCHFNNPTNNNLDGESYINDMSTSKKLDGIIQNSDKKKYNAELSKQEKEEEILKVENNIEKLLESNRGSSSSPSQSSHKSQDSGFSDSEIQNNGVSSSRQNSPEFSPKNCELCQPREESKIENFCKSSFVEYPKTYASRGAHEYLETAFDSHVETPKKPLESKAKEKMNLSVKLAPEADSFKQKRWKNSSNKIQISGLKFDGREKINQIQNSLELSFKLSKKIGLRQNFKFFTYGKPITSKTSHGKPEAAPSRNFSSFRTLPLLCENDSTTKTNQNSVKEEKLATDEEGFKVPKLPREETKTGNNFLDSSDIEGPPVLTSTPKSFKFRERESPDPRTVRATEKKKASKTTFATVRKLKVLPPQKPPNSAKLLNSFEKRSFYAIHSGNENLNLDAEASVNHWLSELECMYEAEIMTTLQSKSLACDLTRQVTSMADTTSHTIKQLHEKTKIISYEFTKLFRQSKSKKEKRIPDLVRNLVMHIREFVTEYVEEKSIPSITDPYQRSDAENQRKEKYVEEKNGDEMITDFGQPEPSTTEVVKESRGKTKEVLEGCERLQGMIAKPQVDFEEIEMQVSLLGRIFTEVVDVLLESHIQAIINVLEEPRTELALRTALSALITLGLEVNHLSNLVSRCGGIRALLAICLEGRASGVRIYALRALATVCCVSDTIRQFEQAGGVEILADILADSNRSEMELSEASAVIAQITAPWVQDNQYVEGLSQFLNSLVTSLTCVLKKHTSCETLLLSSAALANLTFMEPRTVWSLLENETANILLKSVRHQGPKVSVFIQEQAAAIIANMASVPECRKHLAEQRAVAALLCFLEIHQSPFQRIPEIAAAERVQQKSAIALSRLCSDATVAKQVVELQGVNRLVRLCRDERERNHSDGVLVACLATLRKLVANCGTEILEGLNAKELVEPRLLDSFLLYSSKQESYV